MRLRSLLIAALCAVLALPAAALAHHSSDHAGGGNNGGNGGQPVYQVSGGGQIIAGTEDNGIGAGHTIAFTAQLLADGDTARGQFRYIDRSAGAGQDQEKRFGTVTCVLPDHGADNGNENGPKTARFGGELRDGSEFVVDVTDNGTPSNGTDMIVVRTGDDAEDRCDAGDPDQEDFVGLARGNVTIHDRR